jgi:histidinol-phosphate/aromatic aminotransferase/cobyric acid decarboxylase-like protein
MTVSRRSFIATVGAGSVGVLAMPLISWRGRENLEAFQDAGYKVPDCQANFMMIDIHRDVKAFKAECIKHKVAIGRQLPSLPTYARVSFGTMPEMKKALGVFKTMLA